MRKEQIARDMARQEEEARKIRMECEFDPPRQITPRKGLEGLRYDYNGQNSRPPAYARVTTHELPICGKQLPRLKGQIWWLAKQTWQFKPEEMHDLEFQPAVPIFAEELGHEEGYFAALNLANLGSVAVPALVAAIQSTNPAIRIRVAGMASRVGHERFFRALFDSWNDPEAEVRMNAARAASLWPDEAELVRLFRLLWDEDQDVRETAANLLYLRVPAATNYVPIVLQMLKEHDAGLLASAVQVLSRVSPRPPVTQADRLRLLRVPRFEVFNTATSGSSRTRATALATMLNH
jgi:hypothetical protein